MITGLPGLNFKLFGFPVTIGLDFLILTLFLSIGARGSQPIYLLEWLAVVTLAILVHELGHAFVYRHYSITPQIRLWGLGGLTISGFPLPPRKAILVSLAGPGVGIVLALLINVLARWLPNEPAILWITASDLVWVGFVWGFLNLLPIAGLDGGNIVQDLFLIVRGPAGRRPGLVLVAVTSIAIAVAAPFIGFVYLSLIVLVFGLLNPVPYQELWRIVQPATSRFGGGRGAGSGGSGGGRSVESGGASGWRGDWSKREVATVEQPPRPKRKPGHPVGGVGLEARRRFGETYAETTGQPVDLDELDSRPEPLLADVAEMLRAQDDRSLAARIAGEEDELSVLEMVARAAEAGRSKNVIRELRAPKEPAAAGQARERREALLKVQIALHALGRYDESIIAGQEALGWGPVTPENRLLVARSAARRGDKGTTRHALEEAVNMGLSDLTDAALGDLVRLGPDPQVSAVLARLRERRPAQ